MGSLTEKVAMSLLDKLDEELGEPMKEEDLDLQTVEVFNMKPMADVMDEARRQQPLGRLCSSLIYENDLCMLFSDTNVGKTLLAMDIANMIASGEDMPPYQCDAKPQKVLYIDCEMSQGQLFHRYENRMFHENLIRATLSDKIDPSMAQELAVEAIRQYCGETGCRVVFVDNITALGSTVDVEDATDIMLNLKRLTKSRITVIVIAHTPKIDANQPLVKESMGGAKVLANLCDSIIGIARTRQGYRYVKQLKTRMVRDTVDNTELDYFTISDDPYLHFQYEGKETEQKLLYTKQKLDFFHKVFAEDKTLELNTLVKRIREQTKSTEKAARNRIDRAVKSGTLNKDKGILSLND